MKENFDLALRIVLKEEGSAFTIGKHDAGGPTKWGIIQREYDPWREKKGLKPQSVRYITMDEVSEIYRTEYWDEVGGDELPAGLDFCVFDAGVNSGTGRAKQWLAEARKGDVAGIIDNYCDIRLAFLRQIGGATGWEYNGKGWSNRVAGVRRAAKAMEVAKDLPQGALSFGSRGDAVRSLQERLRALQYPAGAVDGDFGEQTQRAVILFQHDQQLSGAPGVWLPEYDAALDEAPDALPSRRSTTTKDLERAGDRPIQRLGLMQRILGWVFGAATAAQIFGGSSVLETATAARTALEPVRDLLEWTSGHAWLLAAIVCAGLIAIVRLIRSEHVEAYRNFDYQGAPQGDGK